jgi:CRISPR/Cas system-associated exonuclease Cas4 (RecB family)
MEFHFRYVEKIHEPEVWPDARIGKAVHAALEGVLLKQPPAQAIAAQRQNLLNEEEQARYDELSGSVLAFKDRIDAFRSRRRIAREFVEYKLAFKSDLQPTFFVSPDAFFRGVWDLGFLFDDGMLAVVDHKTGIRRTAADYADQLEGYATLAAASMRHVKKVWLGIHFVPDAVMEWTTPVDLQVVRDEYAPRVIAQIDEAARAVGGVGPPATKISEWCRRCSYRSICPAVRAGALETLPEAPVVDPEDIEVVIPPAGAPT